MIGADLVGAIFDFIKETIEQEVFWVAIQSVATAGTLVYLARQTISMKKSLAFDMQWRAKEKTAELAAFYSASILPRMSYLSGVLTEAGASWLSNCVVPSKMQLFTLSELKSNLPNYEEIQRKIESKINALPVANLVVVRSLLPQENRISIDPHLSEASMHALLIREYEFVRTGLLNDLEHFSMCVNSGIPNIDLLYDLVAKSYLSGVQECYLHIASLNEGCEREYYAQIIGLYCVWREKYEQNNQK